MNLPLEQEIKLIKESKKGNTEAKTQLLQEFYERGCLIARKMISGSIFSIFSEMTNEEIKSIVYQAFELALEQYDVNQKSKNVKSFKNYFYLKIHYQIMREAKMMFKTQLALKEHTKIELYQEDKSWDEEINIFEAQERIGEISLFLIENTNKKEYTNILLLKSRGIKNEDICKILSITPMSLKSKLQYIRKLIREHFGTSTCFS